MTKLHILLTFNVLSICLCAQKNIVYHVDYNERVKTPINGYIADYSILENDTINYSCNNIKEGKWINWNHYKLFEIDSVLKIKYDDIADSIITIKTEGFYKNNKKEDIWKIYSEPVRVSKNIFRNYHIERIIYYKYGIKDSIELFFYPTPKFETTIYWKEATREKLEISDNDTLVLVVNFLPNDRLANFTYYEKGILKYKWKYVSDSSDNYVIEVDSKGNETVTIKKRLDETISEYYYDIFLKAL